VPFEAPSGQAHDAINCDPREHAPPFLSGTKRRLCVPSADAASPFGGGDFDCIGVRLPRSCVMPAKQVILVATDLGESADEAARQAHEWATATGSELVACFVIPQSVREESAFPPAYADDAVALLELERRASELVHDRISALTRRDESAFRIVVDGGRADLGIVRVADEVKATLIVVGNRRSSELDRLLLGSISERVVRYASCSVLVARSHRRTNQILVATDLSDAALPAVAAAAEVAARRKASLTIIHCRESPAPDAESSTHRTTRKAPQIEDAGMLEGFKQLAMREGVSGRVDVVEGEPREAIVRKAEQLEAELIVVGTRGRTGLSRIMFGSVAETVARSASCPVLAVRQGTNAPA
jgi:nucleotide-binding universal stress UspA family protein